jgi:hypothetical protein
LAQHLGLNAGAPPLLVLNLYRHREIQDMAVVRIRHGAER